MNLLTPGSHRAGSLVDDEAVVTALLRVEVAWAVALSEVGAATAAQSEAIAKAVVDWRPDLAALITETEAAGNPVVPLVRALRSAVADPAARALVHRGLTSQDVLDTALILVARDALRRIRTDLVTTAQTLGHLAREHGDSVMPGRTLTQYAVPITFGLKAAQWLAGVLDALELATDSLTGLPVQCGGAAGTLALTNELTDDPSAAVAAFARALELADPGVPWHTTRTAVTRLGHALVTVCDALGVIAADVLVLSRPEIAEVREGAVEGRGGSSTMPHKRNPVLSVLMRSAALQAPLLGAQLHLAAAQAVDERPDGAWHSEWNALRTLLELTVTAAAQSAELIAGLEVDVDAMAHHVAEAADDLLAERGSGGEPSTYLGSAGAFTDRVLDRLTATLEKESR
ncbi:lyase family protein [Antrihabitans sp. YC2-6]|uniref:lyase family protein n=1 Tax=Antrihabitans sp. YC2-6 TaxID=2799498 RepID=UPI0018F71A90|nr:lyase family protein [Antrihabitans sp. YC2-6]MBJ8345131.1 3-carboxy-cis,cis-muconate cycloisomerase [Antrihabitans sp. YC2-6]